MGGPGSGREDKYVGCDVESGQLVVAWLNHHRYTRKIGNLVAQIRRQRIGPCHRKEAVMSRPYLFKGVEKFGQPLGMGIIEPEDSEDVQWIVLVRTKGARTLIQRLIPIAT